MTEKTVMMRALDKFIEEMHNQRGRKLLNLKPSHGNCGIKDWMSRCCNAPVRTTIGIIVEICTVCGKENPPEQIYGK